MDIYFITLLLLSRSWSQVTIVFIVNLGEEINCFMGAPCKSVKRDLKDWNISKEIALDRSAWRLAIMCLNLELISFGFHL